MSYYLEWQLWLTLWLPGKPQQKQRHRARVVAPKGGGKPFAQIYTPAETRDYELGVTAVAAARMADAQLPPILEDPISLRISAIVQKPKSAGKTRLTPSVRPDLDNYLKSILDGLHVCWRDDAQIVRMFAEKRYAEPDEQVGVSVAIIRGVLSEGIS